jgi:hypothetical protein
MSSSVFGSLEVWEGALIIVVISVCAIVTVAIYSTFTSVLGILANLKVYVRMTSWLS